MSCNLFVADFEVAMIVFAVILLFDLVVEFFSIFDFFSFSLSYLFVVYIFDVCLGSSLSFLSNVFWIGFISVL